MVLELSVVTKIVGGTRVARRFLKALSGRPRGRNRRGTFIITFDLDWEAEWAGIRRKGTVRDLQLRVISESASNVSKSATIINDRLSKNAYITARNEISQEMQKIRNNNGQLITESVWDSSEIEPTLTRQPRVITKRIEIA